MTPFPAIVSMSVAITFTVVTPAAARPAAEGERLFKARCASCHATSSGPNRIGPPLAGVVGRMAGSVEGVRYSRALEGSEVTWSTETLDAYLANPRQFVPGTSMTVALRNASERTAIITYLEELAIDN
jgi:cytochrome c